AARGLDVAEDELAFVDPPPGALASRLVQPRVVFRGRRDAGVEIYLARTRQTPEGAVLAVTAVHPLTRTASAVESGFVSGEGRAAWWLGGEGRVYRVELADLSGEDPATFAGLTRVEGLQRGLTALQSLGQWSGVGRRSFRLEPAARAVTLERAPGRTVILADDRRIEIPDDPAAEVVGARFVQEEPRGVARPGNLVTWAVDRARDLPWFGDRRMQLLKAVAYRALDAAERTLGTVRAPDAPDEPAAEGPVATAPVATNQEDGTGWPPAPLPAPAEPPLDGEGRWIVLDGDPYVGIEHEGPPALLTTFLRGDGDRMDSYVYVVAWDPRQIELDLVAGTEEPVSATGETGSGLVPREPRRIERLVAAFNGGFQSTHGAHGLRAEGKLLVPPLPYAATVARLADGSVGFGVWPDSVEVPAEIVAFRQNLSPLLLDGAANPYGRTFWGGVPEGWEDETRTVRSALCLAKAGHVAYFYGTKIDPRHLTETLVAAGCDTALHLDMNQGHTGLELYRVFPAGALPPLPGKLDGQWKAEGEVEGLASHRFRGRRLIRSLQLMHFPRYVRRSAREFFTLSRRPLLPPPAVVVPGGAPDEGRWALP
ncbi:MAG: hypothetical protein FJ104_15560, partial [Deltaproteobacteria bacterium]|nr:hypothetical protein [Deltaproteobacteria bacterium]